MLDSVVRVSKKYYLQILLEECKYEMKKNKMENLINDDLGLTMNLIVRLILDLTMDTLLRIKTVI